MSTLRMRGKYTFWNILRDVEQNGSRDKLMRRNRQESLRGNQEQACAAKES